MQRDFVVSRLVLLLLGLILSALPLAARAALQTDLVGPLGSGQFGAAVFVLPSGNIVVTDPNFNDNIGAVYLYNGATGALISTLTGSTAGDNVGGGGITVLNSGNYVVSSPAWSNGAAAQAGAMTLCSATTGCTGPVAAANSLVGSTAGDSVGADGVTALSSSNYVVMSPYWNNGAVGAAGAVTLCSGPTGCTGPVAAANSLVGSTDNDNVGIGGVTALSSGNYVVMSPYWNNGAVAYAGAVTLCSGPTGCAGPVAAANSLVGSTDSDYVGIGGITALSNGNYVVTSPIWHNGAVAAAGAVTLCSGPTGCAGLVVSAANSLVGSTVGDFVGFFSGATALSNSNYVVTSPYWTNGAAGAAGAVTLCSGTTGCTGMVSAANSLVGSTANDNVGGGEMMVLSGGNYVVSSPGWTNGAAAQAGAVTLCDGTTGCTGPVAAANSLVGSTASDEVGNGGITVLSTGNWVVSSPGWSNGAVAQACEVTLCNGTTGCTGPVSAANSLIGSTTGDSLGQTGYVGVTALSSGNYVVTSPNWHNGAAAQAGAVTLCSGTTGCTGPVSTANSLVGNTAGDYVGGGLLTELSTGNYVVPSFHWHNAALAQVGAATLCSGPSGCNGLVVTAANSLVGSTAGDDVGSWFGVTALSNGNYVVKTVFWHNGAVANAGAITLCRGLTGCTGMVVSTANSLFGSTDGDNLGDYSGVTALSNGNYVVKSSNWHNGAATQVGAVTLGEGIVGSTGPVSAANSVLGTAADGGGSMNFVFDDVNQQLVVGRPADNIVTLFRIGNNGIPAAVEDAAPNQGDGNNDGMLDSLQPNVASLPASSGWGYLTLVAAGSAGAPDGCSILRNVQTMAPPVDPGFRYPFGMVGFELDNCPPPFSTTITIILHGGAELALSDISYREFGPMAPDFTGPSELYPLLSGAPNNVTPGTTTIPGEGMVPTVTFTLVDNQRGDGSGSMGTIIDPGGPAVAEPAGAPVVSPLGLLGLVGLLSGVALLTVRRPIRA